MKTINRILAAGFTLAVIAWASGPAKAQSASAHIDLGDLIDESQIVSDNPDEMTFLWWVVEPFWKVSLSQDGAMTEKEIDEFTSALRPYTVIIVADGAIGITGDVSYRSEADIRAGLKFIDAEGVAHAPADREEVDEFVMSFLNMMKPFLSNMLGPMGENMNFFVFKNPPDRPMVDLLKAGSAELLLGDRSFKWRLPFGSLLKPKLCPVDGEKMSGAWKFCPLHGVELKQEDENGAAPAGQ